jgi:hypothetical protein
MTQGWISVDHGSMATLPLTMPCRVFKSSAKDSGCRLFRRKLRGGQLRLISRASLANGTGPCGARTLTWGGPGNEQMHRLLAWIQT